MVRNILFALFCSASLFAQGVKIGTQPGNPVPSAGLELDFSDRGFLLPRLTTAQRNAIVAPATGLVVYNTTTSCVETHINGNWVNMACECTSAPAPSSSIQMPSSGMCIGASGLVFTTPQIAGASAYTWTVPSGMTITSGQGTASLTVSITGAVSGNLTVTSSNTCGASSPFSTAISVQTPDAGFTTSPATPTTNGATTLVPNTSSGTHSWTMASGTPATSSATSPSVTWTNAGTYAVAHTLISTQGCTATVNQNVTVSNCVTGGSATFNYTGGIVNWTVPAGVCVVTMEVRGAQGGNGNAGQGGRGARIIGTVNVSPGQTYQILVGQQGLNNNSSGSHNGQSTGGGGGSFVALAGQPIVVAGGGGGGGGLSGGSDAPTTTAGGTGQGSGGNAGGTGGQGGSNNGGSNSGRGGGGFFGNGLVPSGDGAVGGPGFSFVNGGAGGSNGQHAGGGGFGGGGGGGNYGGGGGGGYSGGGGGASNGWGGGGGGSFNSGTNQTNTSGFQTGNGQIIFTW